MEEEFDSIKLSYAETQIKVKSTATPQFRFTISSQDYPNDYTSMLILSNLYFCPPTALYWRAMD